MTALLIVLVVFVAVAIYFTHKKTNGKGYEPKPEEEWHVFMTDLSEELYECYTQSAVDRILKNYNHEIETFRSIPAFWNQLNQLLISMGWRQLS